MKKHVIPMLIVFLIFFGLCSAAAGTSYWTSGVSQELGICIGTGFVALFIGFLIAMIIYRSLRSQ